MIFVNYRISDSNPFVARLENDLTNAFGHQAVFRDKTGIRGGEQWPKEIEYNVKSSPIVLVVIGKAWASAAFTEGEYAGFPRLFDPNDSVRKEITIALDAEKTVIPVLVDDAAMPGKAWLLNFGLDRLADLQAVRIRTDDYQADFQRLLTRLQDALTEPNCVSAGCEAETTEPPPGAGHAVVPRRTLLSLKLDETCRPTQAAESTILFLDDLVRGYKRLGSLPPYEVVVEGYSEARHELQRLEQIATDNDDIRKRRFALRRMVDDRCIHGGLPVDLYITEAIGIAVRLLGPHFATLKHLYEMFEVFLSIMSSGWPEPNLPFDIYPIEEKPSWYARACLTPQDVNELLITQKCPSVGHLTREWGMRVVECPVQIIQMRIVPGMLHSYLSWFTSDHGKPVLSEEHYFQNMFEYGIGLH